VCELKDKLFCVKHHTIKSYKRCGDKTPRIPDDVIISRFSVQTEAVAALLTSKKQVRCLLEWTLDKSDSRAGCDTAAGN
jgi:hypothetical protein